MGERKLVGCHCHPTSPINTIRSSQASHALWKTSQILPAYSKSLCMHGKDQNTEHRHMCQQSLLQPLAQQVQHATLCHPPRAKVQSVTAGLAPSPRCCPSTEHICSTCKGESPLYTVFIFYRDTVSQEQPHSIHAPCSRSPVQGSPVHLEGKDRGRDRHHILMYAECVCPPAFLKAKISLAIYGARISCTVQSFLWTQLSVCSPVRQTGISHLLLRNCSSGLY